MKIDNTPMGKLRRHVRRSIDKKRGGEMSVRLHCKNLSDRLMFESSITRGVFRLVNQSLVFSLMLIALKLSGEPAVKRGIDNDLKNSFD
jgi:hypothetical protein